MSEDYYIFFKFWLKFSWNFAKLARLLVWLAWAVKIMNSNENDLNKILLI